MHRGDQAGRRHGEAARPLQRGRHEHHRHQQQRHEGQRIENEDPVIVQGEAPLPQEHQGHERDRQRHQQEAKLVHRLLKLIERQIGVLQLLGHSPGKAVLIDLGLGPACRGLDAIALVAVAHVLGDVGHAGLPAARRQAVLAALDQFLFKPGQTRLFLNHRFFDRRQNARCQALLGSVGHRVLAGRLSVDASLGQLLFGLDHIGPLFGDLRLKRRIAHLGVRHEAEREEHHEQGEQEHGQGRDVARPPALHPFARQPTGVQHQQRQGAPEPPVEMHDPVQQFLAQMQQGAVNMGRLPAVGAEPPRHLGPAVGAGRVVLARLPRRLLDDAGDDAARHGAARCFQINHAVSPRIRRGLWSQQHAKKRGAGCKADASRHSVANALGLSAGRPTRWRCGRCGSGPRRPRSNPRRSGAPCRS
jgi:hypothetical protein